MMLDASKFSIICVLAPLLHWPIYSASQNLVSNPSFEEIHAEPDYSPAGINESPHWSKLEGTTDFFHAAYRSPHSVPDNWRGEQQPASGDGYAGIITGSRNREYLVTRLNEPLAADQIYDVRFEVSLSEQSKFGHDALGVSVLHDEPLETEVWKYIYVVRNVKGSALVDTLGWTTIEGQFRADGGEEYLLIGSLPHPGTVTVDREGGIAPWAYYFIDDVYLAPCPKPVITKFELDTVLCGGQGIALQGLPDAKNHRWHHAGVAENLVIEQGGLYYLDNHYDCQVIQQVYKIEFDDCDCTISLPTLYNEATPFYTDISPIVIKYDLEMYGVGGKRVLSLKDQEGGIVSEFVPTVSSSYFWTARLTCMGTEQVFMRDVSGKMIVQN